MKLELENDRSWHDFTGTPKPSGVEKYTHRMSQRPWVQKWKAEMRRFDEDFRPLTAETLKYCLKETQSDGIWPNQYARSIVHLELLRREEYLERIRGKGKDLA